MTSLTTRIELTGPFFERDPEKTVRQNIQEMLDALSGEMQDLVRSDIASRAMPRSTGWSLGHTLGYTTSPRSGKHWQLWAAVGAVTAGMDAKDAIRTKAAAASIERRWHPYRNVKSAVYRARAVASANLSKGLE